VKSVGLTPSVLWLFKGKLNKVGKKFRFGYLGVLETPHEFSFGDRFYCGPFYYFSASIYSDVILLCLALVVK
jgi:hypothetical protein